MTFGTGIGMQEQHDVDAGMAPRPRFLYFARGENLTAARLDEFGLKSLDLNTLQMRDLDGSLGTLAMHSTGGRLRVKALLQGVTWHCLHDLTGDERHRNVMVGMSIEHPPQADDLARDKLLEGEAVTLGDGGRWIVPTIRKFPFGTSLPLRLGMNEGQLTATLRDEHREVFTLADSFFRRFVEGGETPDSEDCFKLAVAALSLNYRVTAAEVVLLGLFDSVSVVEAARAAIDYSTLADVASKARELPGELNETTLAGAAAAVATMVPGGDVDDDGDDD